MLFALLLINSAHALETPKDTLRELAAKAETSLVQIDSFIEARSLFDKKRDGICWYLCELRQQVSQIGDVAEIFSPFLDPEVVESASQLSDRADRTSGGFCGEVLVGATVKRGKLSELEIELELTRAKYLEFKSALEKP